MKKKTAKIWMIALAINLILNIALFFCTSCNVTLGYLASIIGAFTLGFYVQEYIYGEE